MSYHVRMRARFLKARILVPALVGLGLGAIIVIGLTQRPYRFLAGSQLVGTDDYMIGNQMILHHTFRLDHPCENIEQVADVEMTSKGYSLEWQDIDRFVWSDDRGNEVRLELTFEWEPDSNRHRVLAKGLVTIDFEGEPSQWQRWSQFTRHFNPVH
jgi:hypothetical protein